MVLLIIFGVTIGAILGTRFRVFVVVPAIFFAAAIVVAIGYVNGLSGRTLSLALLAMLVSLELGYLVGCLGRPILSAQTNRGALPCTHSQCLQRASFSLLYFMNTTAVTTPDQGWRHLTLCCQLSTADPLQHATPSRTA
jgi:hypothetical protein